jgi:hypothetical protein
MSAITVSNSNLDVRGATFRAALGCLQLPPRASELRFLHVRIVMAREA